MIEEFVAASEFLNKALERYVSACTMIHNSCVRGNWLQLNSALQELSDRVVTELSLVTVYENKLKMARLAINRARNCCATLVPVNALPDELLTRIFQLVLSSQPCTSKDPGNENEDYLLPKYPDLLSHVCSRWRRVSTSSRALWSHIDLAPCSRLHQGLVNRAEMCANRAGDLPLYVHVLGVQRGLDWTEAHPVFERFVKSVPTRIKSLELSTGDKDDLTDVGILDTCFQNCKPGILTELTIMDHFEFPGFIRPSGEDPEGASGLQLESSYERLEGLWHHITVLRLHEVFPYWTSKAYHGLVELRLTASGYRDILISESQLVAILSSSPQLRILHFDVGITDQVLEDELVLPVHLGDLQVASFTFADPDQAGRLLRWLAPGSMPLQLSIAGSYELQQFLSNGHVKDFFARCMITRFRLRDVHLLYHEVVELLGRLPYLRVFALEYCKCRIDPTQTDALESQPGEHNALAMPARLERFYMLGCHSGLDGLQWMVEKRLAQTLTFWDCTLIQDTDTQTASITQVDEIFGSSPGVELITGGKPNPSNDWD